MVEEMAETKPRWLVLRSYGDAHNNWISRFKGYEVDPFLGEYGGFIVDDEKMAVYYAYGCGRIGWQARPLSEDDLKRAEGKRLRTVAGSAATFEAPKLDLATIELEVLKKQVRGLVGSGAPPIDANNANKDQLIRYLAAIGEKPIKPEIGT